MLGRSDLGSLLDFAPGFPFETRLRWSWKEGLGWALEPTLGLGLGLGLGLKPLDGVEPPPGVELDLGLGLELESRLGSALGLGSGSTLGLGLELDLGLELLPRRRWVCGCRSGFRGAAGLKSGLISELETDR